MGRRPACGIYNWFAGQAGGAFQAICWYGFSDVQFAGQAALVPVRPFPEGEADQMIQAGIWRLSRWRTLEQVRGLGNVGDLRA